jgi:hypothetical protein
MDGGDKEKGDEFIFGVPKIIKYLSILLPNKFPKWPP